MASTFIEIRMAKINPKSVIHANSFNLEQLLSDHAFNIPDYQREFVWKADQVNQLWFDIFQHFQHNTKADVLNTSPNAYFLGAIVVLQSNEDGVGKLDVIDGQQRLTTLTCIAATLKEFLGAFKKDGCIEIEGMSSQLDSMIAKYSSGSWWTKVTLGDEKTNQFFLNSCKLKSDKEARETYWIEGSDSEIDPKGIAGILLGVNHSPANKIKIMMERSYVLLAEFLKDLNDNEKLTRLSSLIQIFAECIVILKIEAVSDSTAYSLFESLNYRGMSLTQADLIKNEIIRSAHPSEKDDVIDCWNEVKDSLDTHGTIALPDFLHYSYLSRYADIKANKLFDSVKTQVSVAGGSKKYAEHIKVDAEAFECLVTGHLKKWSAETNNMLKDIREVLNIKLSYVALISGTHRYGDNKIEFEKFVRLILNFSFRYVKVNDGDIGKLAKVMNHVSGLANNENKSVDDIAQYLALNSPDLQFIEAFKTFSTSNTKLSYFIVYYLEKCMLHGTNPVQHGALQNLEHIMPKTPTETDWPNAKKEKDSDSIGFKEYLWRVGNLLPLPEDINKSIKNKSITHKMSNPTNKDYENCALYSPKNIRNFLDNGEWTYDSIKNRQEHLANTYSVKAWSLELKTN